MQLSIGNSQKYVAVKINAISVHLSISNNYNMGMSDLPDMYAQIPRAAGLRAEGIHIRPITCAHVTTNMKHLPSKLCLS